MVRAERCPLQDAMRASSCAVGLKSKLGYNRKTTILGNETLTNVASAAQAYAIAVTASMTCCLQACGTCTVIQTTYRITVLFTFRR